jgi:hypothetical protein
MNIDTEIVGNKYNQVKDLDVKDIAKLIRQDLKKFKDCKFSVSIHRYSGGRSLNVKLVECSNLNRFEIFKSEYCDSRAVFINEFNTELKSIINQYNFDRSNPQSDYFHVNFYEHLYIDRDLEIKIHEQLKLAA